MFAGGLFGVDYSCDVWVVMIYRLLGFGGFSAFWVSEFGCGLVCLKLRCGCICGGFPANFGFVWGWYNIASYGLVLLCLCFWFGSL